MIDFLLPTSLFAIALGLIHAFEADHFAAVSTLVAKQRETKCASVLGALWGLGHTTTLLGVGILLLALKITVPTELSFLFETIVGIMLIGLGLDTIKSVRKKRLHVHSHTHGESAHIHMHMHEAPDTHNHHHTSFIIGLFHGLAGSGALVLATIASTKTLAQGSLFIALFGFGSILGMTLLSAAFGYIVAHTARIMHFQEFFMFASGALSIVAAFSIMPIHEFILRLNTYIPVYTFIHF